MKRLLPILVLLVAVAFATSAMAASLVLGQGYTAYIGESNYLFLEDPNGSAKVLRAAISNLISMDETTLYCLTAEGRLYGIKLDGSGTEIVAANPTAADMEKYAQKLPYILEGQTLSVVPTTGSPIEVAQNVTAATANATNLFYMQTADGATSLYSASLTPTGGRIVPVRIGDGVASPYSMYATKDYLTILQPDRTVSMVNLSNNAVTSAPAASQQTTAALFHNGNLIRYTSDARNNLTVEGITAVQPTGNVVARDSSTATTGTTSGSTTGTGSTTAAATATPRPTAAPSTTTRVTTRATARPRSNTSGNSGRLSKGSTGARVRKLQSRLSALGYPVGSVDGKFGDATLHAVNLFQTALGEREVPYASTKLLKKVQSKNAPKYDAFRPVSPGDKNAYVKQMQKRLIQLGYLQGDADGIFGVKTQTAMIGFQTALGYPINMITGAGDRDTLIKLYDVNAPAFAGAQPMPLYPTPYPFPWVQPPLPPFVSSPSSLSP